VLLSFEKDKKEEDTHSLWRGRNKKNGVIIFLYFQLEKYKMAEQSYIEVGGGQKKKENQTAART
jgi:hypothetical protein